MSLRGAVQQLRLMSPINKRRARTHPKHARTHSVAPTQINVDTENTRRNATFSRENVWLHPHVFEGRIRFDLCGWYNDFS